LQISSTYATHDDARVGSLCGNGPGPTVRAQELEACRGSEIEDGSELRPMPRHEPLETISIPSELLLMDPEHADRGGERAFVITSNGPRLAGSIQVQLAHHPGRLRIVPAPATVGSLPTLRD